MSTWYYAGAERQPLGPLSTDELKQHFHSERIALDTLVWRDGMMQWRPLADLAQQLGLLEMPRAPFDASPASPAAFVPPAPPTVPAPPTIARVEAEEVAAAVTAPPERMPAPSAAPVGSRAVFNLGSDPSPTPVYERPEIIERMAAAGTGETAASRNPYLAARAPLQAQPSFVADQNVVYAGFWKRAAATIIDGFILSLVVGLCGELFGVILSDLAGGGELATAITTSLSTLALNALYFAWFHSTFNYATPGKMAIGIKVVRSHGEPISFLRALARFFATILSTLTLFIGYLMAAFTARKQSLHDIICDTVVVDKWAYTSEPERQRSELGLVAIVVLGLYGLVIVAGVVLIFFVIGLAATTQRFG